jgi:hypothetical protein
MNLNQVVIEGIIGPYWKSLPNQGTFVNINVVNGGRSETFCLYHPTRKKFERLEMGKDRVRVVGRLIKLEGDILIQVNKIEKVEDFLAMNV